MRSVVSLLGIVLAFTAVECSKHYLLLGHVPNSRDHSQLPSKELKSLITTQISNTFPNQNVHVSSVREKQQRSKLAELHLEVQLTLDFEISDKIFKSEGIRFTSYKEVEAFDNGGNGDDDDEPEPDCFNDGFLGADGTCSCPEQYSGSRCEYLVCFNGGVPDYYLKIPQCFCPPGYNDFFCANRGCRPAIEDDINPPKKNLIVIMPATTSFQPIREKIMEYFIPMVNWLEKKDPNWIGLYVGMNYYETNTGIQYDFVITNNLTSFVNQMTVNTVVDTVYDAGDQSMLAAIDMALWDSLQGYATGYPLVFAYSNTANKPEAFVDINYNQQPTFWRAKVFMNVINDKSSPVDTQSTGFTAYHTYSQNTHSPLLFYKTDDIDLLHTYVLPQLYKPQYIDVRSQSVTASGLVKVTRDYYDYSQVMNLMVTTNQPTAKGAVVISDPRGNKTIDASFSGQYWAVYTLPENWDGYAFKTTAGLTTSFYTWVSSDETALWAGHEDTHTDVGDVVNNAEAGYHFALTPVGFNTSATDVQYVPIDSSNAGTLFSEYPWGSLRPGCTMVYEFVKILHCNPGPFVHKVTIYNRMGTVHRVFPGLCVSTYIPPAITNATTVAPMRTTRHHGTTPTPATCSVEGTAVFADDRNHPFRDFIFAAEWSDSDSKFLQDVELIVPQLLDSVYDVYYQQRFTFIVFNQYGVKTLVSHTRKDIFEQRVRQIVNIKLASAWTDQLNDTETSSDSIDSVIMANVQTLNPQAQVYMFTSDPGSGSRPNLSKLLPKSIQVNYFYYSQIFDAYPFSIMTRQTNGRWFSAAYPRDFIGSYLPQTTELIYDTVYQNEEGTPFTHQFSIEAEATLLEIFVNGALKNYTISAASGVNFQHNTTYYDTMGIILADLSNRTADTYTFEIFCTYCAIQIRVASPIRVILGFTASPQDDTNIQTQPSAWLRMIEFPIIPSFVVARVNGLPSNETVTNFTVIAYLGSFQGSSFFANTQTRRDYMTAQMQLRNFSQCSYQWIGQISTDYEINYWTPELDGMKFLIKIKTANGVEFSRLVYYYVPEEILDNSVCQNGATVIESGVCRCTSHFTGDFCAVPVCQNGGTQNFGACNCDEGYVGRFCEIKITEQYVPIITTTMQPTTPTTQTPTSTKITQAPVTNISILPTTAVPSTATKQGSSTTKPIVASLNSTMASATVPIVGSSTTMSSQQSMVTSTIGGTPTVPSASKGAASTVTSRPQPPTTTHNNGSGGSLISLVVALVLCIGV